MMIPNRRRRAATTVFYSSMLGQDHIPITCKGTNSKEIINLEFYESFPFLWAFRILIFLSSFEYPCLVELKDHFDSIRSVKLREFNNDEYNELCSIRLLFLKRVHQTRQGRFLETQSFSESQQEMIKRTRYCNKCHTLWQNRKREQSCLVSFYVFGDILGRRRDWNS